MLEGRYGFFETFLGAVPEAISISQLDGQRGEEILGARTKRLPGTSWNVVPIELMRCLVREENLLPDQASRIDIALSDARKNFSIGHSLGPDEKWRACSSGPFQMAMILLDGGVSKIERYDQPNNPDILAIIEKMRVTLEAGHENDQYARIEVTTQDGNVLTREGEDYSYRRLDDRKELHDAGDDILSEHQIGRLADLIEDLPSLPDVSLLAACLSPRIKRSSEI